jgi:hypothetical protein
MLLMTFIHPVAMVAGYAVVGLTSSGGGSGQCRNVVVPPACLPAVITALNAIVPFLGIDTIKIDLLRRPIRDVSLITHAGGICCSKRFSQAD